MSGLNLTMGAYGRAGAQAAMPVAANNPTGTTISRQAFGIRSGYENCGPRTAGLGTAGIATACAIGLAWLWWSLPR